MVKVPGAADVKTRLRPMLSAAQCDSLSVCFLQDTIAGIEKNFKNIIVAFTPEHGREQLKNILGEHHTLIAQRGSDLGERLIAVIADAHGKGFAPVIVVGTDSPTLPPRHLAAALEHLQMHDNGVSVGPTEDGGYYLIGLSKPREEIFRNISWSTNCVFDQTVASIKKAGDLELQILPTWHDIDEPDDLRRLGVELTTDEQAGERAKKTRSWMLAAGW